jgi:hypothetical protein
MEEEMSARMKQLQLAAKAPWRRGWTGMATDRSEVELPEAVLPRPSRVPPVRGIYFSLV